jgi:hypothetical protein
MLYDAKVFAAVAASVAAVAEGEEEEEEEEDLQQLQHRPFAFGCEALSQRGVRTVADIWVRSQRQMAMQCCRR